MDPITQSIVTFAHELDYGHLSPSVIHETKRRLIDSIGCAYGAYHSDVSKVVRSAAKLSPTSGKGGVVIGQTETVDLSTAVFANGALIRYLDYNDTYLSKEPAHPSDNIAATLTVAASEQKSGKDLILATIIAYEIQCRLCDAASLRAMGWDHVTYGPFSAGLATAKLLDATQDEMTHTVGIAGVCNNAMRQTRVGNISMWKASAFAAAARGGVQAATLAHLGMTGPNDIFTGLMGFQKQVSGPFELGDLSLSPNPFMLERTYIKDHPAEYHSQSAIDIAKQLHTQISDWNMIEKIVVDSHDASVDIIGSEPEKWHPKDKETADHSLPYITAVALMFGDVKLEHFTPTYFKHPELMGLVQKIAVERDSQFSEAYPENGFGNRITITFKDGSTLSDEALFPKGHPQNAHTDDELAQKFRHQSTVLSLEQQDRLLESLFDLENVEDVSTLFKLMVCDL